MPSPLESRRAVAVPRSVAELREAAARAAIAAGAVNGTVAGVRLAVSEACTNAILHAFPPGRPGEVCVDVEVDDEGLLVRVRDDGWGIRPRADSPGAGLGLPVITRLSRRVDIARRPEGGTEVRMWFPLGEGRGTAATDSRAAACA